jgi:hypothetical protein
MTTLTTKEVIEMAKEAGMMPHSVYDFAIYVEELEAFAKLVAQHEREACAKLCENFGGFKDGHSCAESIRARGEA